MNRHEQLNALLNTIRQRNGFIENRLKLAEVPSGQQVDEIEQSADVILNSIRKYKELLK
jgi:hypothetical protein